MQEFNEKVGEKVMATKSSWDYSTKYNKTAPKGWNRYITNTRTLIKNAKIAPKNRHEAGITNSMNKKLHFHLNRSVGQSSYAKTTGLYFDRLYSIYPQYELTSTCTYVFFVRPILNILDKNTNQLVSLSNNRKFYTQNSSPDRDQFFRWMRKSYPYVLFNLSGGRIKGHDFMPILTGKTESISLPDYTIKDYKLTQPYTGYNMPYASHALESMTGGEFEVTFRDDAELSILKLFQTWLYYINGVTRNVFSPRDSFISNNKADYCTSVYVITCKEDATEIIHWMKYTGAFPTKAPHSNLSFNLRGKVENRITIPFAYFHQAPLDPLDIIGFNKNAHVTKDASKIPYVPIYNKATVGKMGMKDPRDATMKRITGNRWRITTASPVVLGTGNGFVKCPFICKLGNKYYLRWKKVDLTPT